MTMVTLLQIAATFALVWSIVQQVRWTKRLTREYKAIEQLEMELIQMIVKGRENP